MGMVPRGQKEYEYLIILGAHVEGRKITDSLYRPPEQGFDLSKGASWDQGGRIRGTGQRRRRHGSQAMEDYLIAQGIASYRIIKEDASTTTQET